MRKHFSHGSNSCGEEGNLQHQASAQFVIANKRFLQTVGGEIDALCERITVYPVVEDGELIGNARNPKQVACAVEIRKRINKTGAESK